MIHIFIVYFVDYLMVNDGFGLRNWIRIVVVIDCCDRHKSSELICYLILDVVFERFRLYFIYVLSCWLFVVGFQIVRNVDSSLLWISGDSGWISC